MSSVKETFFSGTDEEVSIQLLQSVRKKSPGPGMKSQSTLTPTNGAGCSLVPSPAQVSGIFTLEH